MNSSATCRSCGAGQLTPVLDLGKTPLANSLPTEQDLGQPEETFPLELVFCGACALLQITETVDPAKLFGHYLYFSSFSDTMVEHARTLAARVVSEETLGAGSLVVEAASNDGYLLQHYQRAGVPVLGVEPATNIAKVADEKGIPTRCEFFGRDFAAQLAAEGKQCDVFHGHNVLAHVADLNGFVNGIATLLKPTGVAVLEVPQAKELIDHLEFDTIYHEHLCYFSLTALKNLFARHGLKLRHVEEVAIHGGSLRVFVVPEAQKTPASPLVQAVLDEERRRGLGIAAYYRDFSKRVLDLKRVLTGVLTDLKAANRRIAAYGASAKGSTLLNFFGIDRQILDFVADRSTHKQGRFMPGVKVPIVGPEAILAKQPDYVLLLTWNFMAEILEQQAEYRHRGGRFIIPVPSVRVL